MIKTILYVWLLVLCVSQNVMAQKWQWAKQATTSSAANEYPVKMAVDNYGYIYTLGRFSGQLSVGTETFNSLGTGDLYLAVYNPSGAFIHARQIKISQTAVGPYDIAIKSDGFPVIIGSYLGTLNIDYDYTPTLAKEAAVTGQRSFVAELRFNGLARWVSQSSGVPGYIADEYTAVTTDKNGNIYIAYNQHRELASPGFYKLNTNGSISGSAVASGSTSTSTSAEDIEVDNAGNVYLVGALSGNVTFGSTTLTDTYDYHDAFIAKFNKTTATWQWAKKTTNSFKSQDLTSCLAISSLGPVLANTTLTQYNFDGAVVWNAGLSRKGKSLAADNSGNVYVTGGYSLSGWYSTVPTAGFVEKFNSTGNTVWTKKFAKVTATDPSAGFGSGLVLKNDNTLIVSGAVSGGTAQFDSYLMGNANGNQTHFVASLDQTPNLTLSSPNGGETLTGGSSYTIQWQNSIRSVPVSLEYTLDGVNWQSIVNTTPGTGSYTWLVPKVNSTTCKIRVRTVQGIIVSDESDAPFTILLPSPTISIRQPNGGEALMGGQVNLIIWATEFAGNFLVEYSVNDGVSWQEAIKATSSISSKGFTNNVIITPSTDWQSFRWLTPNINSSQCRIRVSAIGTTGYDISDDVFSILGSGNSYRTTEANTAATNLSANSTGKEIESNIIYPNPVKDQLTVQVGNITDSKKATVTIYSVSGAKVATYEVPVNGTTLYNRINVTNLKKGVYTLVVETGRKVVNQLFIKD